MSSLVSRVAIVGGGVSATASAIQLAKAGVEVDLFEKNSHCTEIGSGITLQGNCLKAFDQLGVWEELKAQGFPYEGLTLRAPGPGAPVVADLPDINIGGSEYPASMGMYRPDLAETLHRFALAQGVNISYNAEVTGFSQSDESVEVQVNGKSAGTYDLLIGADGLNSSIRTMLGIETKPQPTGMGIWRAFVPRPEEVQRTELYYGGPAYIAGYTPTGEESMYAILVEKAHDRAEISASDATASMVELSAAYDGPWNSIRESLQSGRDCKIHYTKFTQHLVEVPWHRGRVVIIGDAAHSCPPTIAQGAAQAIEDAIVLTELLTTSAALDENLWNEFYQRRIPRIKTVVEASVQLGQWQLEGNREANPGALIHETSLKLMEPA